MPKRQRVQAGSSNMVVAMQRPRDKTIQTVLLTTSTTQQDNTLVTADGPCTIQGLRWQFNFSGPTTSADTCYWAIYRLKEGYSIPTMDLTNGNQLIEPEQEVITWGTLRTLDRDAGTGPGVLHQEGSTKSMRKLMKGDRLILSVLAGSAASGRFDGAVQYFCAF